MFSSSNEPTRTRCSQSNPAAARPSQPAAMWTTDCGTHAQIEAAGGASEPIGGSLILRNQQAQALDHAKVPAVPGHQRETLLDQIGDRIVRPQKDGTQVLGQPPSVFADCQESSGIENRNPES